MNPLPTTALPSLLRMSGICKSFGSLPVLTDVHFELRPGEVHILAGENGAGKSTLVKILAGAYRDHAGTIELKGRRVRFRSPRHAFDSGVAVIYQELSLIDPMSVSDNLHLGREKTRLGGRVDDAAQRASAAEVLREIGLTIDVTRAVEEYPLAIRQMLEVAKAVARSTEIIVMDEPTSALSDAEVARLFALIQELTRRGAGIVYITHKMEEIERIGDRITVLRDGRNAGTDRVAEVSRDEIVRRMVGRELRAIYPHRPPVPGDPVLEVEGLRVGGGAKGTVEGVSFRLGPGEIVGLAGVQGCGNSELLRALAGAAPGPVSGRVTTGARRGNLHRPAEGISAGIAYLTNDRKGEGIVGEMSVGGNITLASLRRFSSGGWLRTVDERIEAERYMAELRIRSGGTGQEAGELSGGNQQKVLFARWLATEPRVLLLDDPTRGVDVGAKQEIYALLTELKSRGVGMLLISSETPELIGLSDRILVMREGKIVCELSRTEATQESVLRAALGVRSPSDE
jgi:ABC-type sugar transport system ATPase subunit